MSEILSSVPSFALASDYGDDNGRNRRFSPEFLLFLIVGMVA